MFCCLKSGFSPGIVLPFYKKMFDFHKFKHLCNWSVELGHVKQNNCSLILLRNSEKGCLQTLKKAVYKNDINVRSTYRHQD